MSLDAFTVNAIIVADQLDALYRDRQGAPADLAGIDARLPGVKARHPKPGQC